MKKFFSYFLVIIALFFMVGCVSEQDPNENKDPENKDKPEDTPTLKLEYEVMLKELYIEETFVIESTQDLVYSISDSDIISFNEETKTITALKEGEAIVTLKLKENETIKKDLKIVVNKREYTISYDLDGGTCSELIEKFYEGDAIVLPVPVKEGYEFLGWYEEDNKVDSITDKNYSLVARWEEKIVGPQEVVVTISPDQEFYYQDDIIKMTITVLPESVNQEVVIRSLNRSKAESDDQGNVTITGYGEASFKIMASDNRDVFASVTINIKKYNNPYKLMELLPLSKPVAQDIKAYTTLAGYDTFLLSGITNHLFEDIKIIENWAPVTNGNRPGTSDNGNQFSAKYVTVHDVGYTGTAQVTSGNCVKTSASSSWHFSIGNDGVYQQIPMNEVAYHAGDGTGTPLTFTTTTVKAPLGDDTPGKVTINQTSGNFMINGEDTKIKAPLSENSTIVTNSQLPYTGINNYVNEEGFYVLGSTYWNTTYNILSNRGGNLNSIGIESCVNEGSNIYYTWYILAKTIGLDILVPLQLLPRDVKQHNTFSGKNCPMTMREASRWEDFMKLVEFEYYFAKKFPVSLWSLELECESPYVNEKGMLIGLPEVETVVKYSVTLKNSTDYSEKFDYEITLPSRSNYKNYSIMFK